MEIVHHINENKLDNRIENLLITNSSQHRKLHINKKWCKKYSQCIECKETSRKHEAKGLCLRCYQKNR